MIELKSVTKKFDDFLALDDIDLTVPKGSAFGLLGSNGAGKSTILRLISGVFIQDSGTVAVDGDVVYDIVNTKRKIFFINDETVQFSNYTLTDLKNFYKQYYPNFSEEIYQKLLAIVKLPEKKKISQFSKGMKRQAIVIIGIACQTEYLLLDEAFDGLDPTMRIIIKRIIVDAMCDRQLTAIISSHNLKEMNEICDTVALLHKGKIVFSKDLSSVKGDTHKIQVAFKPLEPDKPQTYTAQEFKDLGIDVLHFENSQSVYHIIAKGDSDDIVSKLGAKNPVLIDIIPMTLEEVFIYEMEVLGYESDIIKE